MSAKNSDKQIDNILTHNELVKIAKKITNDNGVRVLDYNLGDYSKDKLGYTATHHILKMTVQKSDSNSQESISAFVKIVDIPVPDGYFGKDIDINSMVANKESFLLNTLVSQYTNDCKTEKWCPTFYYVKNNIVIMENLKSNDYKVIKDFIDNEKVLKSVFASLARFHSFSIIAEARMSHEAKCPVKFNERYKEIFAETMFMLSGMGAPWFTSVTKLTCTLAEQFGHDPMKIQTLFHRVCDLVKPSEIHRNVISHGDVHSKNLMFTNEDSPIPKCILIDFQTYRYAPLMLDILQFLHVNATRKFREKHEESLIKFYHSVLVDTIKSNNSKEINVQIPTLDDINKGMKDLRLFGLVIACIYYPLIYLDPELLQKHARDSEFNKNIAFGDRTEFTLAYMKSNEFFRNKIDEVIRELVERSVLE